MMVNFKIPEKIIDELKKIYGEDVPIENILLDYHSVLLGLLIKDGSVKITSLGTYMLYKTESSRGPGWSVRFKLKPSSAIIKKVKNDPRVLNMLKVVPKKTSNILQKHDEQRIEEMREVTKQRLKGEAEINKNAVEKSIVEDTVDYVRNIISGKREIWE